MSPQFMTSASIIGIEIDGVANENVRVLSWGSVSIAVDINYLPCGKIGGVVRPQLLTSASIMGIEIEAISNEDVDDDGNGGAATAWMTATSSSPDQG